MHLGCTITKTTAAHAPLLRSSEKKKSSKQGKSNNQKKKSKCIYSFIYSLLCFFVCLAVSVVDQKKKMRHN